jgi:agmatinase
MTVSPPFLGFPDHLADGRKPCTVIFGAGHGSIYFGKDKSGYALSPNAIRAASERW